MMNNNTQGTFKLLSVAVPCYNSQDYMSHAVESLLAGGKEIEILIIDDGSTDATAQIAGEFQGKYPGIVRAIHQENRGHGGAVMTGIREAAAPYYKVVDSDDWVDKKALISILDVLRDFAKSPDPVDLVISNFIYDKAGSRIKKVMRYSNALPKNRVIGWENTRRFRRGQYILMHSVIYRTSLLRECGMELPEHTFYVDNLFVYVPMAGVKTMYYLDLNFYHYFIGRQDQSVHEDVMIRRIDQQIKVNKLMAKQVNIMTITDKHKMKYMFSYLEIITTISSVMLLISGTEEAYSKKKDLWEYLKETDYESWKRIRRGPFGIVMNLPGKPGRLFAIFCYKVAQKIFGFN